MNKQTLFGIVYVSIWIIIWGTVGSLIDYPLLQKDVYLPGSIGQLITFSLTGLTSTILSIYLFDKSKSIID